MDLTIILLLVAAGAFIIPSLGGDDDDDNDGKNEVDGSFGNDDPLDGTEGNDLIRGFTGDDVINGLGGNDDIFGGDDNDTIKGGTGLDFVRGGLGNDDIDGGEGDDRLIADRGDDTVNGGFGSDIVRGGQGNDTLLGGFDSRLQEDGSVVANESAFDRVNGETGDDTIFIWGGDSVANGGQDDDTLVLMTGDGFFDDNGGDNDFYAFGNTTDDQETFLTIRDFDPTADTLTLTVDFENDDGSDIEYEDIFARYVFTNGTSDGVDGVFVTVELDDESNELDGVVFESASVFIESLEADDLDDENIDIVAIENADLFNAEGSLDDVQAGGETLAFVGGTIPN